MYLEQIIDDLQRRIEQLEARQPIAEEWLTIEEAAERLQVGKSSLYRKVKSGAVYASTKTGRVRIPISQFYEERKPEPAELKIPVISMPEDPRMKEVFEYVWQHAGDGAFLEVMK